MLRSRWYLRSGPSGHFRRLGEAAVQRRLLHRLHADTRERDADPLEDSRGQQLDVEVIELLNRDQLRIARDALCEALAGSDYVQRQAEEVL